MASIDSASTLAQEPGLSPDAAFDFAEGISDRVSGRDLSRALDGKGAFRRFRNELYQHHPDLISVWQSFRDARARARAIGWLVEQRLLEEQAAHQFADDHPEPALP